MIVESPPARVAWIETHVLVGMLHDLCKSPPARVAWIETVDVIAS